MPIESAKLTVAVPALTLRLWLPLTVPLKLISWFAVCTEALPRSSMPPEEVRVIDALSFPVIAPFSFAEPLPEITVSGSLTEILPSSISPIPSERPMVIELKPSARLFMSLVVRSKVVTPRSLLPPTTICASAVAGCKLRSPVPETNEPKSISLALSSISPLIVSASL